MAPLDRNERHLTGFVGSSSSRWMDLGGPRLEIILRMERSAIEGVLTLTLLTESLIDEAVVLPVEPGRTLGTRGGDGVASWSDLRTCGGVVGGDRRIMLSAGCSPREGGGGGASSSLLNLRSAWRWPWSSAAGGAPYGS